MNFSHSSIELKHLRTLATLRETGSLVTAAERLHLTQSALSHQIKALEHQLGLPLFTRNSRPIAFSEAGRRLLALADELLPRLAEAQRSLDRLARGRGARLALAIECHSCFDWLMPTLAAYETPWPEVEIDLSLAFPGDTLTALVRGDTDLVITADPEARRDLEYLPLFAYESVLVMSPRHRLAAAEFIQPADLAAQTLITYPVDPLHLDVYARFLVPAGISPAERRTTELTPMLLQLVASGRGVAALPRWAVATELARGFIVARRLGPRGMHATLYAAIRAGEIRMPHIRAFVDRARATCVEVLEAVRPVAATTGD